VNGRLTQKQNVQPGAYVLEDVPVVNGAGELQVIARDALGRQQVFTQGFFSSTELLRPGLNDYSVSFGALREAYGLENFQYGDFAASATWRHGLRENLTIEGHGEFTGGLAMLGGAAQYVIGSGGMLSAGAGLSTADSGNGAVWNLGFRQQNKRLNYNLDIRGTTRDFMLVGEYSSMPKLQFLASAGKNFYEYGSAGISIVHQSFHDRPKRTIVSANHSKSFNHFLSLSAYLSYVDSEEDNFSIGIRFSMPFGEDHSVHGGFTNGNSTRSIDAEISRSLPHGPGYGYRLAVGALDDKYIDAGVAAQTELGTYSLDVRDSDYAGSVWQAGTTGSIAYLSGMTKFTRQIRDAFAVVNVGGFEGVRVYSENQEVGRTNKNGQLFVPGLRPYLRNNLRIEIEDLPLNAKVGDVATETAPYSHSGVIVNFNVRESSNVLLRAVLADGSPVPEGAAATINRSQELYPVGRDGKLFLQGIDRSSQITLRWNGQTCDLAVPSFSRSAIIAKLGDIICDLKTVQ
jgi:outer membrane usher protein